MSDANPYSPAQELVEEVENQESGFDGGSLGVIQIGIVIAVLLLGPLSQLMYQLNLESLTLFPVVSLLIGAVLAIGLCRGSPTARVVTALRMLLTALILMIAAFSENEQPWESRSWPGIAIVVCFPLYCTYVMLYSPSAAAFLRHRRGRCYASAPAVDATAPDATLLEFCTYCQKEVELDDEFRCSICNWPVDPRT